MSIEAIMCGEASYRRQRAREEADRLEVGRLACLNPAMEILDKLVAAREQGVMEFIVQERSRRQAWNTKFWWLPRWLHHSLDAEAIKKDCPHQLLAIYRQHGKVVGACQRLLTICCETRGPTVSVTRRDWKILHTYRNYYP